MAKWMARGEGGGEDEGGEKARTVGKKLPPAFLKRGKRMKRGREKGRAHTQARALQAQAAEENEI
jgi:hypothetical protein